MTVGQIKSSDANAMGDDVSSADKLSLEERIARAQKAPGYRRYVYRDGKIVETTPKKGDPGPHIGYGLRTSHEERPRREPLRIPPGVPRSALREATGE